ncbi:hypothetical protein F5Y10DRAFT_271371 [Nemania abortiva]|nr:hypothetical protein F5Y10DRAFT_271371 [Nemania abortiva]
MAQSYLQVSLRGGGQCLSPQSSLIDQDSPLASQKRDVIISHDYIPEDTLRRGLDAVHCAFNTPVASVDYRVIGAGAIWSLGKTDRKTRDFDILVADDNVKLARKLLAQDDNFGETRVDSLYYKAPSGKNFNIDVVTVSKIEITRFPAETAPQHVTLAKVGSIECLLESKIAALSSPARKIKKGQTNSDDLVFLLDLAASKGITIGYGAMPLLTTGFVRSFRRTRPQSSESWDSIGCPAEG